MSKKGRQVFQENKGVTPSVAAPGVTHPSDASDHTVTTVHNVRLSCAINAYLLTFLLS